MDEGRQVPPVRLQWSSTGRPYKANQRSFFSEETSYRAYVMLYNFSSSSLPVTGDGYLERPAFLCRGADDHRKRGPQSRCGRGQRAKGVVLGFTTTHCPLPPHAHP